MSIKIDAVVCGAYRENAYVAAAEGRDDCVVIDPGDDLIRLRGAVGERKVGAILLTHGHFDHILAAEPLSEATGAPVFIHEADLEMLNDPAINAYDPSVCRLAAPEDLFAQTFDERLSVCGLDFTILHTPGHSRGSVCLYLEKEGVLFSGDTLFEAGFGRMDLYGGDVDQMRASLRALLALPPAVRVYPGHGGATTIGDERGRYRL